MALIGWKVRDVPLTLLSKADATLLSFMRDYVHEGISSRNVLNEAFRMGLSEEQAKESLVRLSSLGLISVESAPDNLSKWYGITLFPASVSERQVENALVPVLAPRPRLSRACKATLETLESRS